MNSALLTPQLDTTPFVSILRPRPPKTSKARITGQCFGDTAMLVMQIPMISCLVLCLYQQPNQRLPSAKLTLLIARGDHQRFHQRGG